MRRTNAHMGDSLYKRTSYETVSTFGPKPLQEVICCFSYHKTYEMLLIWVLGLSLLVNTSQTGASPTIESKPRPQVIRYDMETANMPNSYKFSYDASDGSSRTEQGGIANAGTSDAALDVLGTVRWYDDKGDLYEMTYKAGKRGYRTIIKKIS